ncbi:MAG TPA: lipopolysaccharide transport periplasmic protein LptA, partial [Steroidobacteraceae bacterium]|nr:lipopolysaccharide transport periplasmic protein LptA [Steroidobacteraceae bacterium]
MAAPRASRFLASFLVVTGAGLLDAHAAADEKREALPIVIDAASSRGNIRNNTIEMQDVTISQGDLKIRADRASVAGGLDYQNSKWTISGNVRINAQGGSLQSDQAVVTFSDNVITRATITGAPAQFEQQREAGAEPARGRANTIDYETATGNVSLKDQARLSDGCNEIRGEQLVYNIRTQSVQAQSVPAAAGTGDGRIRIIVQPESPSGKP